MNREVVMLLLRQSFPDSTVAERRVVARAAGDLADAGSYPPDGGHLTPQGIVEHLSDAPDESGLVERWNWWMGALDVAYGDYGEFTVRAWNPE